MLFLRPFPFGRNYGPDLGAIHVIEEADHTLGPVRQPNAKSALIVENGARGNGSRALLIVVALTVKILENPVSVPE